MIPASVETTDDFGMIQNDDDEDNDYNDDGGGIYTKKSKSSRKWEWSHLRKECETLGLDPYYRTYIHRMQKSYLSIIIVVQVVIIISHITLLMIRAGINSQVGVQTPVIPDVFIYTFSLVLFVALLLPSFHDDVTNSWRPYVFCFFAIFSQICADLAVPIYHAITTDDFRHLRPMYASHNLLIIYIFLPIADNVVVSLMGLLASICYSCVMIFVTYEDDPHKIIRISSEVLFLVCCNFLGNFFRVMNEIDIRRNLLERREVVQKNLSLKFERNQERELLFSILPEHIAEKMQKDIKAMVEKLKLLNQSKDLHQLMPNHSKRQWSATNKLYAEKHSNVSILYADVVRYTAMTSRLPVRTLVETLHELFVKFDEASADHNVLRIKFLGDCYYGVCGLPIKDKLHAKNCVDLGLQMIKIIRKIREVRGIDIDMRIGVHSGSIIGGVMGSSKWQYDIWSKDVIIANKMESTGVVGSLTFLSFRVFLKSVRKVHISEQTLELLNNEYFYENGSIHARNDDFLAKNDIKTFLIDPKFNVATASSSNGEVRSPRTSENRSEKPFVQRSYSEHQATRKNFMMNSMEQFRDIMQQTNIEMEREIAKMPIGKFHALSKCLHRKISTDAPRRKFYGSDSFLEFEDYSYQAKKQSKVSKVLLLFGKRQWEWLFLSQTDLLLKYSVLMSCIVLTSILGMQMLNKSKSELFFICTAISSLILISFIPIIWFKKLWDIVKQPMSPMLDISIAVPPQNRLLKSIYDFSFDVMSNALLRTLIYLVTVVMLVIVSILHLVECSNEYSNDELGSFSSCLNSWSVTQCLVLTLLATFMFLRIHFMLKLIVATIINCIYYYIIFVAVKHIYDDSETVNPALDSTIAHALKVFVSTVLLHLIDRQSEYIQRVGFIWKQKLAERKKTAMITKETNKILVHNILPLHVADLYLSRQFRNDFYSEEYENVAVMFATIMNFETSVSGATNENENTDLVKLNQIICAFDETLMSFSRVLKIEKIKVAGWSYMCACGLDPGRGVESQSNSLTNRRSLLGHSTSNLTPRSRKVASIIKCTSPQHKRNIVMNLVNFALELMRVLKKLDESNENFRHNPGLKLRVGISHGHVMAGVIGMSKPLYDIWGNSVNMASRMDSTGEAGMIQVTEETAKELKVFGIKCISRGEIAVKGKGLLPTFFVAITDDFQFEIEVENDLNVSSYEERL